MACAATPWSCGTALVGGLWVSNPRRKGARAGQSSKRRHQSMASRLGAVGGLSYNPRMPRQCPMDRTVDGVLESVAGSERLKALAMHPQHVVPIVRGNLRGFITFVGEKLRTSLRGWFCQPCAADLGLINRGNPQRAVCDDAKRTGRPHMLRSRTRPAHLQSLSRWSEEAKHERPLRVSRLQKHERPSC